MRFAAQWRSRWRAALAARAAAWIKRRQGSDELPVTITGRRIYILPSRAGAGFAFLLLFMLIAGLNYSNSLALMLTFLLAGTALVAMHQCHRNLQQLIVMALYAEPAFAAQPARVSLTLRHCSRRAHFALQIQIDVPESQAAHCDALDREQTTRIDLDVPTVSRGRLNVDRVRISTRFPFGLFRAWSWLHVPLTITVYPRPRGLRPIPVGGDGRDNGLTSTATGNDEWADLRPFRNGDSPRRVAWKAYAREAPLLVKEYAGAISDERLFDYAALSGLTTEQRLEQLARWVVDSDLQGASFALTLPGQHIAAASGAAHRRRCLTALAHFGLNA